MTDLMLPAGLAPSNLHLRPTVSARLVTSDLFEIADRLREIDPRLFAVELSEADEVAFAIMEHCADGVERLVFAADVLDARVLEKVRYLLSVPFEQRFAAAERDEAKSKQEQRENELEELYERLGGQMRHDLAKCGFTGPLSVNTPLRNRTARRHRSARH